VTSVEVEGNKIVSTATILTKIKTRPGDRMSQQTVDEDIKRLYSTGFFSDVSADVRPMQGGQCPSKAQGLHGRLKGRGRGSTRGPSSHLQRPKGRDMVESCAFLEGI
jgi:hypothetical protein